MCSQEEAAGRREEAEPTSSAARSRGERENVRGPTSFKMLETTSDSKSEASQEVSKGSNNQRFSPTVARRS
ncbi:hypothetical protein EYF80_022228 [Liparis tanakae]|uniref:Uncharacterized protein n=1 Tax=Liparis tanakae TaxID=230148 RepID=A0A4Z2HQJ0_9TELE|nr:hypothetical protein EYF80_022228 [Liparis tanakae]